MEGMEIAGVNVSIASLVGPFRNIMSFFTFVQSARSSAIDQEDCMLSMEVVHLRFSRWGAAVKLSGEVAHLKDLHAAVRNRDHVSAAKEVLAQIASKLESIPQITTDRNIDDEVRTPVNNDQITSEVLIQRMRDLSDARQCKAKTLRKVRWHVLLEKILNKSFRRQCKLSNAKASWVFGKDDKFKITDLTNELAGLVGELEALIPGEDAITTFCCNEEVGLLLREAQPGSPQLSQLKLSIAGLDPHLRKAFSRREGDTNPRAAQPNEQGFI
jgi:hypothetical protein